MTQCPFPLSPLFRETITQFGTFSTVGLRQKSSVRSRPVGREENFPIRRYWTDGITIKGV